MTVLVLKVDVHHAIAKKIPPPSKKPTPAAIASFKTSPMILSFGVSVVVASTANFSLLMREIRHFKLVIYFIYIYT